MWFIPFLLSSVESVTTMTRSICSRQLYGLAGVPEDKIRKVIIAYEPIWAIGTGRTATPEQAQEVCEEIRTVVRKLYSSKVARAVSILYGGSMNDKNAYELLAQPDIDGGLIGGASLVPEKFVKIIESANQNAE